MDKGHKTDGEVVTCLLVNLVGGGTRETKGYVVRPFLAIFFPPSFSHILMQPMCTKNRRPETCPSLPTTGKSKKAKNNC